MLTTIPTRRSYKYINERNSGQSVIWCVNECAEATGICVSTIFKIRSESNRGPVLTPKKRKTSILQKPSRKTSRKIKYSDFIRCYIQNLSIYNALETIYHLRILWQYIKLQGIIRSLRQPRYKFFMYYFFQHISIERYFYI